MAKKRSTKKARPRATTAATGAKRRTKAVRKAKSKPAAARAKPGPQQRGGETKPKRVGLLDAATQILAKAKEPIDCKAIVEQVIRQKLWSTRGRTPHATLYTAIIREIAKKGKGPRQLKEKVRWTLVGRFVGRGQPLHRSDDRSGHPHSV